MGGRPTRAVDPTGTHDDETLGLMSEQRPVSSVSPPPAPSAPTGNEVHWGSDQANAVIAWLFSEGAWKHHGQMVDELATVNNDDLDIVVVSGPSGPVTITGASDELIVSNRGLSDFEMEILTGSNYSGETTIDGTVAQIVIGLTPAGFAMDLRDLSDALEAGSWYGVIRATATALPGGDFLRLEKRVTNVASKSAADALRGATGRWAAGSFDDAAASLAFHFEKHGAEVGAADAIQYRLKAEAFAKNLRGARKFPVNGATEGVTRYVKNGYYIDIAADGSIISYGVQ